ncbi:hypothetical protein [Embleya sp. NPDC020630]|uniref:hypothetical protein n=1 Tax=Embleya sp. NPDC020630 TaxID=3363979 RepID=UPI0037B85003
MGLFGNKESAGERQQREDRERLAKGVSAAEARRHREAITRARHPEDPGQTRSESLGRSAVNSSRDAHEADKRATEVGNNAGSKNLDGSSRKPSRQERKAEKDRIQKEQIAKVKARDQARKEKQEANKKAADEKRAAADKRRRGEKRVAAPEAAVVGPLSGPAHGSATPAQVWAPGVPQAPSRSALDAIKQGFPAVISGKAASARMARDLLGSRGGHEAGRPREQVQARGRSNASPRHTTRGVSF